MDAPRPSPRTNRTRRVPHPVQKLREPIDPTVREASGHGNGGRAPRWWEDCARVLARMLAHPAAWLVARGALPFSADFARFMRAARGRPMDLCTVRERLECGQYARAQDFVADVRLVFANAVRLFQGASAELVAPPPSY